MGNERHHSQLMSLNQDNFSAEIIQRSASNNSNLNISLHGIKDPLQRQGSAPLTPNIDKFKDRRTSSPFDPNLIDLSTSLREIKVNVSGYQKSSLLSSALNGNSSPLPSPSAHNSESTHYGFQATDSSRSQSMTTPQTMHQKHKGEPSACIFVASLNATRTDEQLKLSVQDEFAQFGPIIDIKVMRDGQGRPFAFVQYESSADAKSALIQGHQRILDGRPVRVEQARVNRTLFVTRYDRNMSEHQLRAELETFGHIEELKFLRNAVTGKSKGCAFIRYHFREDAIKAFSGVKSKYHWSAEWTENLEKRESHPDPFEIFVGQLDPLSVDEQDVFNRFKKYGTIQRVQLIRRNYPGRVIRPSFAFITFTTTDAAEKAIQGENGQEWHNRPLKVTCREVYTEESTQESQLSNSSIQSQYQKGQTPQPLSVSPGAAKRDRNRVPSGGAGQSYPTPYRQRTWSNASSVDSFMAPYPLVPIQSPYTVPYVAFAMMPSAPGSGQGEGLSTISEVNGQQNFSNPQNPNTPPMTPVAFDMSSMMHARSPTSGTEQFLFGPSVPSGMIPSYYYPFSSGVSGMPNATTSVPIATSPTMISDPNVAFAGTSPIYVPFLSFPSMSTMTPQNNQ